MQKGGMSREEALIAFASGVRQFVVLINKMDQVDFVQSRFEELRDEVVRMLVGIGVSDRGIVVIPVSSYHGDNLLEKSIRMEWWGGWEKIDREGNTVRGLCVMDALNTLEYPRRAHEQTLRMPIVHVHKISGVGTVVVGRIVSGMLSPQVRVCVCARVCVFGCV